MNTWLRSISRLFLAVCLVGSLAALRANGQGPVPPPPPDDELAGLLGAPTATEVTESAGSSFVLTTHPLTLLEGITTKLHSFRFSRTRGTQTAGAFDSFNGTQLALDASYTNLYDEGLGGDGDESTVSLFLSSFYEQNLQLGMGITYDRLLAKDKYDIEQDSVALDLFSTFSLNDNFSIGAFVNYTRLSLADATFNVGVTPVSVGGNEDRVGVGVLGNYMTEWAGNTFSLTSSLASMGRESVGDIFKANEASWVSIIDVRRALTESLTAGIFGTYFQLLGRSDDNNRADGFFNAGVDFDFAVTANTTFSLGFEKSILYEDYEDARFNASLSYSW